LYKENRGDLANHLPRCVKGKILSEPLATNHDFLPILDNFFWGIKFYERKRKYFPRRTLFLKIRLKAETSSTHFFKKIEIGRNGGRFGTTEVLVHKKSNFTTKASKETK